MPLVCLLIPVINERTVHALFECCYYLSPSSLYSSSAAGPHRQLFVTHISALHVLFWLPQDNVLALVSSSRSSRTVQQAAAALLLQLVAGLKASLALARHPELAHSQFRDSSSSSSSSSSSRAGFADQATVTTAMTGPASKGNFSSGSTKVQNVPSFTAAAATLAAMQMPPIDPTCPNSYPRLPMPDDVEGLVEQNSGSCWQLPGLLGAEQQQVDVTAAVVSILLQVRNEPVATVFSPARSANSDLQSL
jgi:hypothetical protein